MEHEIDLAECAEIYSTCVCLQLRKTSRAVTQMYDDALRPIDLLSTQLPILMTLALCGHATITYLAEELVMDRTSVTRLIRPLESRGLIKIVPGEDRRTRDVSLTPLGEETLSRAIPLWKKAQSRVTRQLGQKRVWLLRENLSAAISAAGR